ncbi:MAG: hypothetical protein KIS96_07085 [Bauldia sp.]|nr:hypothetical protein [Bauldia sp.]
MRQLPIVLGLTIGALLAPAPVYAQFNRPPDIWNLELGAEAASIPRLDYQDYACGTNGGPPARPLSSFADFLTCQPEPDGLREVQFGYDDEQEYVARAYEIEAWIERLSGTRPFGAPSIVSALFDPAGVLRGLRIVTDNRVSDVQRAAAHTYRYQYKNRFGLEGWACIETPPDDARQPVGDAFVDERCTKSMDGLNLRVVARYYRRPGESTIDPVAGRVTTGLFESSARLEVYQDPYRPAD